jgi:hypothetical protein
MCRVIPGVQFPCHKPQNRYKNECLQFPGHGFLLFANPPGSNNGSSGCRYVYRARWRSGRLLWRNDVAGQEEWPHPAIKKPFHVGSQQAAHTGHARRTCICQSMLAAQFRV